MVKSNKIVVNRQKLFLDFVKGEIEIKINGVYTDDYAFDSAYNYQKTNYMIPDDKMDYFPEITRGHIYTQDNINYSCSFASFKYFDLKRVPKENIKAMDKKDIYLLEIIQDIKKDKSLDSHNMSNTLNRFTLHLIINYFNKDVDLINMIVDFARHKDDTQEMINNLDEQFKNIDLQKYLDLLKTWTLEDIKKLGVYSRYEFDFIKMYIDNLQEKAFKKIDNIINFPLPPAPGPDITPQKAPEFYSSQLDIFGGEQKVICNYSQMSLF